MGSCYITQGAQPDALWWPIRVGKRLKREGICAYLQLIHIAVEQKPTQHYKAIILQLKFVLNKFKREKKNKFWETRDKLMHLLLFFSHSVLFNYLQSHGLQQTRLPSPSQSPGVCSNLCPLSQWCHPTISSSVTPFSSCPPSFPASGSFPLSQFSHEVAKVLELQLQH